MDEFLIVGIESRTSKSGNAYKMLHLSQPFSDLKYGVGSRTSVEYVSEKHLPQGLRVGDCVKLGYGRAYDGKAYVNSVTVLESPIEVH